MTAKKRCESCEKASIDVPAKFDANGGPYSTAAVATDTPQCSQVGVSILKQSGSAVDAAIAAMFCVGVINLHSAGIGGGGVMLVYNRRNRTAEVIDFRETAPSNASEDMFKGRGSQSKRGKNGWTNILRKWWIIFSCYRILNIQLN